MNTIETLHNVEAEQSLIGCVLVDPEVYKLIPIELDAFFIDRHRWIWETFTSLDEAELAIDVLTVADDLRHRGKLDQLGGVAYLTKLMNSVVFVSNAESYARIINDMATRRNHLGIANLMAKSAHNGGVDVATVIDLLADSESSENEGRLIGAGVSDLYDNVEEKSKKPRDVWGIPTGFIDFDKRTGGLHRQQMIIIPGDPGVGKTTLMLQFALNAAMSGKGVAIFELEMDEQRVTRRLVEILTGVPNRAMLTGNMGNYWDKFTSAIDKLQNLPIYINDDPGITTAKMRSILARLKTRMDLDLVCLDYLGLLNDIDGDGKNSNNNEAIKGKRFRQICREFGVAGLSVQDLTKEGMRAGVKQLADMSGPSKLHFGADSIFFLQRNESEENEYWLLPAKQRDGDSGSTPIKITRRGLPFANFARDDMYPKGR